MQVDGEDGWVSRCYSLLPPSLTPYARTTVVPSAGSSTFQLQTISFSLNLAMMRAAISPKLLVASARIVGPAPDRQTPNRPGCVAGVMDSTISVSPGISVCRYGWCSLSCIAR